MSNPISMKDGPVEETDEDKKSLYQKVQEYYMEKSVEVPDKRKASIGKRFLNNWPVVLYESFVCDFPEIDISRSTFYAYKPVKLVMPCASDWGTCLCWRCANPALKNQKLKAIGDLPTNSSLDIVIKASLDGDNDPEDEFIKKLEELSQGESTRVYTYKEWQQKTDFTDELVPRKRTDQVIIFFTILNIQERSHLLVQNGLLVPLCADLLWPRR